ncbi:MAG TPA: glycosyltransferase family 4 protein [Thermoanaerobaculia bacterium]|nr:glycosyltransferase family 4 protein [Thermoanaerobaculia bacterium]
MRIVYVVASLDVSGGVRVIVEHAEELRRRGHDATILSLRPPAAWMEIPVPVTVVPGISESTLPEADLYLATWYETVVPTARAAGLARTVHFCQGYEAPHPHLFSELGRIDEAYRLEIPKVVISAHLVDVLSPLYPGEYHVIPQAIRAASFAPAEPGARSPRIPSTIGVVGPFEAEMKGIRFALEAVLELRREGRAVRLHRASQMPLSESERDLCAPDAYDLGRPAADMPAWYAELDLLIHPSFPAEGFPLPPLEAMASGVPVVLTDIPSFRPIPADAVARVSPGDARALAGEARRLLDEPELWSRRRLRALDVARSFTIGRAVDALEAVLVGILRRR